MSTDSPTRSSFVDDSSSRSIFDKLRKPGSMSSFSSFIDRRRKNGSNSPGSFFMHASSNASKASLVSMESRDSGYRNLWNDSGIDLDHDVPTNHVGVHGHHGNGWGSFGGSASRPNTSSNSLSGAFESKFPFGVNGNASTSSLNTPMIPGLGMVNGTTGGSGSAGGDVTPKYDAMGKALATSGSAISLPTSIPSAATTGSPLATTASASDADADTSVNAPSGYPAPIGPPR
jgi:hypothetical protein